MWAIWEAGMDPSWGEGTPHGRQKYPSGTSIRFAFPLTRDPLYGWTESPNLLCYKLFMKSLAIPF